MAESTFSAEEMDLYSRQIGAFGMETMMKLVRPPRSAFQCAFRYPFVGGCASLPYRRTRMVPRARHAEMER